MKTQTVGDIVREYFPNATDDFIEFVTWERTGFPSFWNIPQDGDTPEACFRKQLQDFKEAMLNGISTAKSKGL